MVHMLRGSVVITGLACLLTACSSSTPVAGPSHTGTASAGAGTAMASSSAVAATGVCRYVTAQDVSRAMGGASFQDGFATTTFGSPTRAQQEVCVFYPGSGPATGSGISADAVTVFDVTAEDFARSEGG